MRLTPRHRLRRGLRQKGRCPSRDKLAHPGIFAARGKEHLPSSSCQKYPKAFREKLEAHVSSEAPMTLIALAAFRFFPVSGENRNASGESRRLGGNAPSVRLNGKRGRSCRPVSLTMVCLKMACDHSVQLTPVRSLAWVGAFSHKPWILAFATPVLASWNRYPFT